jgi:Tat protein secretion system quality control protein TatD with DNase activity
MMLRRAKNAGVEKIIVTTGSASEAEHAVELVNTYGMLGVMITRI